MANRVRIEVSADLGDTVAKLEEVAAALRRVKDAGGETTVSVDKTSGALRNAETAAKDAAKGVDAAAKAIGGDNNSSLKQATKSASKGIYDVGRALDDLAKKSESFFSGHTGRFGSAFDFLGNSLLTLPLKFGGLVQGGLNSIFSMLGIGSSGGAGSAATAVSGLTAALGGLASIAAVVTGAMLALGAAVFLVVGAVNFLFNILGMVTALVAGFVGPLGLLATLLGGLGVAFGLAGQRAMQGGGHLQGFANQVKVTGSMFDHLVRILAGDFLPIFNRILSDVQRGILFFDRLARMPLDKAFKTFADQGVPMFSKMIDQLGQIVAHPIRLAFKIAFGPNNQNFQTMVADWWHDFTGFLLGYTQTHQAHIGRWLGPMQTTQVKGIFAPLINWFNQQHFTQWGLKLGHEMENGFFSSGFSSKLGAALAAAFADAFKRAAVSTLHFFEWLASLPALSVILMRNALVAGLAAAWPPVKAAAGAAWRWISNTASSVWRTIRSVAVSALNSVTGAIRGPLESAWNAILGAVRSIGGGIRSLKGDISGLLGPLASALSAAQSLASALSLGGGSVQAPGGGRIPGRAAGGLPPGVLNRGIARVVNIHVHGADLSTAAHRRVVAQQLSGEMMRVWSMGHAR